MMKVLSTKQLDGNQLLYADKLGLKITTMDVVETTGVNFEFNPALLKTYDGVVFTSQNAVNGFFAFGNFVTIISGKKIFATSGRTANALAQRGFIPMMGKNANELADVIINNKTVKSVMHICGNLKLDVLEEKLTGAKISYTPLVVYETILLKEKAPSGKYDAVMLYSPSGVESYFSANKPREKTAYCCIGDTTAAAAIKTAPASLVFEAKEPTPESMMDCIVETLVVKK
ncbi:MAG TPA: uroporphyrinogen-III synthase [Chitinophagales bacterium]|nr:uroporphyrinogen-III synthase [Chitinophagales bacterium]